MAISFATNIWNVQFIAMVTSNNYSILFITAMGDIKLILLIAHFVTIKYNL